MAAYDAENYPSRNFVSDAHRRLIEHLLKRLAEYEAKSHPDNGEQGARGKDLLAFSALQCAGRLVHAVAGWAIDHQVGLALQDLAFVPLQPTGTKQHREYLEARKKVDSHEHEHSGGNWQPTSPIEPLMARRLLRNLLRANSGAYPSSLIDEVVRQLEGLDFGEPASMFQPIKTDAKVKLEEMRLQLEAVCFVECRMKQGLKKYRAAETVARALGIDNSTLLGWWVRLPKGLGRLAVDREISFARNLASYSGGTDIKMARRVDQQFGDAALQSLAGRYKAFKQSRKDRRLRV